MEEERFYKLKQITWPPWSREPRTVPILLQDVNGPCPLIAIMNVLLLRGTLTLPASAGEIAQARVVQLLAEHCLDTNFSRFEGGSSELKANLQHNLSDAISLLPKLTTGIDVNVRFDGIRSIEFTGETVVFDLLGIDLVHGWLYDPLDVQTAAAIGDRSYNELILQAVSVLGEAATPRTVSGLSGDAAAAAVAAEGGAAGSSAPGGKGKIDAAALSAALQSTLRVTIPEGPPVAPDLKSKSTPASSVSQDSVSSAINRMLGDTVKEAFKTPNSGSTAPASWRTSGSDEKEVSRQSPADLIESVAETAAGDASVVTSPPPPVKGETTSSEPANAAATAVVAAAAAEEGQPSSTGTEEQAAVAGATAAAETAVAAALDALARSSNPPQAREAESPTEPPAAAAATPPEPLAAATAGLDSPAVHDALVVREFLETNPSQLTVYGLSALAEGLTDGSLAVLFRNNHFNVVLCSGDALYILVTDQGYLFEPDIVWEHLVNVDGDTQLVKWDLRGFEPHNGGDENLPPLLEAGQADESAAVAAAAAAAGGGGGVDSDFALAMQLQQEEEERLRAAEERRRASTAAATGQQLPPHAGIGANGKKKKEKKKKKETDCCIM